MIKRKWLIGVAALALIGVVVVVRLLDAGDGAAARSQARPGSFPSKSRPRSARQVPVRLNALGTVTPIASVAIKARVDTNIVGVHFRDGQEVKKGDLLFTLDGRAIRPRSRKPKAPSPATRPNSTAPSATSPAIPIWSPRARRRRSISTTRKTQADVYRAAIKADQGAARQSESPAQLLHHHRVDPGPHQRPAVKVGNFVRQADTTPMATINQMAPVYVEFTVPQKNLPDIRQALADETATIDAIVPGPDKRASGQVTMIENTVDPATGMAMVRATMPNKNEMLWPGTLVTTEHDVARRRGGGRADARRCRSARPGISSSSSRTASPRCRRSRSSARSKSEQS